MKISRFAIALILFASAPVFANCQWEWLCKGDGSACKQMPVCDTLYDTPPAKPDSAPPAPPIAMRPDTIASDLGTASCEHVMRKNRKGEWEWSRACYCSDPATSKDPNDPLANIVRCTAPWKE